MLLKQMLEAPTTSPNLVVFDPFQAVDRESLLKEVVGLANAAVEGPRNILFGVNPAAIDGAGIVGIPEDTMADLKRAHRLISAFVEPVLDLAFIFDCVNGKLVGALEIDGCDFGPYFLAQDLSDELRRGACWIRRERELVAVERRELINGQAPAEAAAAPAPAVSADDVRLVVGFNSDPGCEFLEVDVPDTSDPPFSDDDLADTRRSATFTQTLKEKVGTMTTQILKMKKQDRASNPDAGADAGDEIARAANQHYYYEERAVKLDVCIRNDSGFDISDLRAELGFPRLPGFDIADRIYTSPFDKRGVVISGLVHNDDPNAAKAWMTAGSYWTQAAGEVHITAAKGSNNIAYIEIEESPYLVLPTSEAFDEGDTSVNIEQSNIVWLDATNTHWITQAENISSKDAPKIAFLWGTPQGNQLNGTFVKMPSGFSGKIKTRQSMLRGIVIQGRVNYQVKTDKSVLVPGSYFSSEGEVAHKFSVDEECIIYIRSVGKFDVVMD